MERVQWMASSSRPHVCGQQVQTRRCRRRRQPASPVSGRLEEQQTLSNDGCPRGLKWRCDDAATRGWGLPVFTRAVARRAWRGKLLEKGAGCDLPFELLQLAASRLTPPKNRLCRRFCMSWPDARTGTSEERAAAQDTWRLANRSIKFNQVFGVRLSVSMVGSLGHLVDRGVLGRCSCMWRSGLVRTPPCHANWHVSASHNCLGLWHSRITSPQHPLIQVCRFNSRLQSISYRSSTCAHHA